MEIQFWIVLAVAVVLSVFCYEFRKTLREIEADLRMYLSRLETAAEKADPSVWVHYDATATIIHSFITKYFE
jgi:hypothetical protein